jgi:hypothetical protein
MHLKMRLYGLYVKMWVRNVSTSVCNLQICVQGSHQGIVSLTNASRDVFKRNATTDAFECQRYVSKN